MWGQLAFPRPVGLGLPPRGRRLTDNGSDPFLESVDCWVCMIAVVARPASLGEAGRPPSGPSRPSVLPTLHSAFVLPPEKWITNLVLILGCLVDLWINVNAFRCF